MQSGKRIDTLDGFRALAILSVMLFHYYSRWSFPDSSYLPFDPLFKALFQLGIFGVRFFFVISGFVIFYTLEKSTSIWVFFIRRWIKLFPPMLFASILIYYLMDVMDPGIHLTDLHSFTPLNFLPGLTFTAPPLWNTILRVHDIRFINGSFWSLYVEVTFYLIAGILFFANKKRFVSNWVILVSALTAIRIISVILLGIPRFHYLQIVPFAYDRFHFVYFTAGIIACCLYFKKQIPRINYLLTAIILVYQFYIYSTLEKPAFLVILLFFAAFVYKSEWLGFCRWKLTARIGVISYTLYLIHEPIGVVLIYRLTRYTSSLVWIRLIEFLVILFVILMADLIYRIYENPVHNMLKKWVDKLVKSAGKPQVKDKLAGPLGSSPDVSDHTSTLP